MPALNFKPQFAPMVENGLCGSPDPAIPLKRQTIRAGSRIKAGDKLILYTGQRTSQCRKLGEAVCRAAREITLRDTEYFGVFVNLDKVTRFAKEIEALAIADGFKNADQFIEFFRCQYGLPLVGQLIEW